MSEEEDSSQKTEEPSHRKLEEAREKGQVVTSREVNNWMMLLAILIIVIAMINHSLSEMNMGLRVYIEKAPDWAVDGGGVEFIFYDALMIFLKAFGLPLLVLFIAAFAGPVMQTQFNFSAANLLPKLDRLSIFKGFERIFSSKSIVEFLKGLFKLSIVGSMVVMILWPLFPKIEGFVGLDPTDHLFIVKGLVVKLTIGVLSIMGVIAAADYLYQRFEFMKKMRMSKFELKEEYRQTEGDPQVKAKLGQLRQERARKRMITEVPKADVIITNPTHYAIALMYKPEQMQAPKVIAKGVDLIAQNIKKIAKAHDIPTIENKPLARGLYESVELDQEIPETYYKAVAEVISYVFKLKGKAVR